MAEDYEGEEGVGLAAAIGQVRAELMRAVEEGRDSPVRFRAPVEAQRSSTSADFPRQPTVLALWNQFYGHARRSLCASIRSRCGSRLSIWPVTH